MNTQEMSTFLGIDNPWPVNRPKVELDPHSWFSNSNEETLRKHLLKPHMEVLELGAWLGASTRFFAAHSTNVITIDTWLGSAGEHTNSKEDWYTKLFTLYNTFITNCWDQREKILPIRMWTQVGMDFLLSKGYNPDLIYIDAGHTYEDVKADITKALEFPGDVIITGDDFLWGGDLPVQRAAKEMAEERGFQISNHGMFWWYTR